jgi:hypothetical protein
MKPGDAPLDNLAHALLLTIGEKNLAQESKVFTKQLHALGVQAVLEWLTPVLDAKDANLLLLVDQFEEVFRFGATGSVGRSHEDAAGLVVILLRLAVQTQVPVFVCMTMRSDYLGDCDTFYGLPEAMNRSQYLVPRLTRAQRREAIVSPIQLSGTRIAPRLIDRLLNENIDTRDDLPVLQHALMRTWKEWSKNGQGPIDIEHYEKHTLKEALNLHAQEALERLSDEDKLIAKHLFQTLTETDEANRRIRRPAHLSDVIAISGATPDRVIGVIKRFREDNRSFLVLSSDNPADDPLIDISHESLIRQWPTLSRWVDEEAESAKSYRRLAESAELNRVNKAGFYRDPELQTALDWRGQKQPNAAWGKRYHSGFDRAMDFLDKSRNKRDVEAHNAEQRRVEREKLLREKAELAEKQARQQRKILNLTLTFTVVIAIVMVMAIFAAWQAIDRREEAQRQTLKANYHLAKVFEEKAIHALGEAQEHGNTEAYQRSLLYTAAALEQKIPAKNFIFEPTNASALFDPYLLGPAFSAKWFSPSAGNDSPITSVAFSPDGQTLASASADHTVRLWNLNTGQPRRTLQGHSDWVSSVVFSPNGQTLASASYDRTVRLWNLNTGQPRRTLHGHSDWVSSVVFSPDSQTLASASGDRTVRLWDLSLFNRLLPHGKASALVGHFYKAIRFLWEMERDGLKFRRSPRVPTLKPIDEYGFVYDKKFRPLLDPPKLGQTKLDQILEWAEGQVEKSR